MPDDKTPDLLVDTREPWEEIADRLSDIPGPYSYEIRTLNDNHGHPKADFVVQPPDGLELAIQRKTAHDYASSLDTLKDDLYRLRTGHEASMLLVEGDWEVAGDQIALRRGRRVVPSLGLPTWHNFILSQQVRGTMYARTSSLTETCRALVSWIEWCKGDLSPPTSHAGDPATWLATLPRIGPQRAQAIIDEYQDGADALQAVQDWEEVAGIGEVTHQAVLDWLTDQDD